MEEGEAVVPKLWVYFDSKPHDKGEPGNVRKPSEKICCKKVPVVNAKRNKSETSTRTIRSNGLKSFWMFKNTF